MNAKQKAIEYYDEVGMSPRIRDLGAIDIAIAEAKKEEFDFIMKEIDWINDLWESKNNNILWGAFAKTLLPNLVKELKKSHLAKEEEKCQYVRNAKSQ